MSSENSEMVPVASIESIKEDVEEEASSSDSDVQEYILEAIRREKEAKYLIKWKGFPESDNTWVKESDFAYTTNGMIMLAEWKQNKLEKALRSVPSASKKEEKDVKTKVEGSDVKKVESKAEVIPSQGTNAPCTLGKAEEQKKKVVELLGLTVERLVCLEGETVELKKKVKLTTQENKALKEELSNKNAKKMEALEAKLVDSNAKLEESNAKLQGSNAKLEEKEGLLKQVGQFLATVLSQTVDESELADNLAVAAKQFGEMRQNLEVMNKIQHLMNNSNVSGPPCKRRKL